MRATRCQKRAVFDNTFRCVLKKGHKGDHQGPLKKVPGTDLRVRTGFCHSGSERCHHK